MLHTLRFPSWVKVLSQLSSRQVNGLACLWVIWWARTLPRCANRLWHISHLYGFSPVCRLSCVCGVQRNEPTVLLILTGRSNSVTYPQITQLRESLITSGLFARLPIRSYPPLAKKKPIHAARERICDLLLTNGLSPVCALIWISRCVF